MAAAKAVANFVWTTGVIVSKFIVTVAVTVVEAIKYAVIAVIKFVILTVVVAVETIKAAANAMADDIVALIDGLEYFVVETVKAVGEAAKATTNFAVEVTKAIIEALKKAWNAVTAFDI